ncbi:hypothetical protein ABMA57_14395 [Saccharospirillum sp. HFRX-1]|uniref:hypothetical protein n=1 Tax=unclassified Saccharospirillum TaxID=2633430 RepID=UPI0037245222
MPQNQQSGARANDWGRQIAREIAEAIGAEMLSKNSNECKLEGERAVIKCAKLSTDSVGVTYKMLERIQFIIGAFQAENGKFDIYKLPSPIFQKNMRATASHGSAKGKVGIVRKTIFHSSGKFMSSVKV